MGKPSRAGDGGVESFSRERGRNDERAVNLF